MTSRAPSDRRAEPARPHVDGVVDDPGSNGGARIGGAGGEPGDVALGVGGPTRPMQRPTLVERTGNGLGHGGDHDPGAERCRPAQSDWEQCGVGRLVGAVDCHHDRRVGRARRSCLGPDEHHRLGRAVEHHGCHRAEDHGTSVAPMRRQADDARRIRFGGSDDGAGGIVTRRDVPARDRVAPRQAVEVVDGRLGASRACHHLDQVDRRPKRRATQVATGRARSANGDPSTGTTIRCRPAGVATTTSSSPGRTTLDFLSFSLVAAIASITRLDVPMDNAELDAPNASAGSIRRTCAAVGALQLIIAVTALGPP
jgi:hypothetical protein